MRLRIRGKIYSIIIPAFILLDVLLTIVALLVANYYIDSNIHNNMATNINYYNDMINVMHEGDYYTDGQTLYKGNDDLKETTLLNKLKSSTNFEYTLFLGDARLITTIESKNSLIGTKADTTVINKVLNQGNTIEEELTIDNRPFATHYEPIKNTNGEIIGMLFVGQDISHHLNELKITTIKCILIGFAICAIALIATSLVINSISKAINKTVQQLNHLSEKDFTLSLDSNLLARYDEVGMLSRSMKVMQDNMIDILTEVTHLSNTVNESSRALSTNAHHMAIHSEKVVASSQEITSSTTTQAEDLIDIDQSVEMLSNSLANVVHSMSDINDNTIEIGHISNASKIEMEKVTDSIHIFNNNFQNYTQEIQGFKQRVNKVNQITEAIENIAKQTNLLALNAAIEAARAGEAGKGFSVVAEEIRLLAEQSQNSAQNISKIINSLSDDTTNLASEAITITSSLNEQTSNIGHSIDVFQSIVSAINSIIPLIQNVKEETSTVNTQNSTIRNKINNSSCIAQNISASCEEVASSTEEINVIIEELEQTSEELEHMIQQLSSKINTFKLT